MLTGIKLKFDFYRAMIVCFFCYDALSGYVIALCNRLPLINYIGSYVPLIIIVLFVAINLLLNKPRRLYILDVIIPFSILVILCVTYVVFPNNADYYNSNNMEAVFFKTIPFFILGVSFRADKKTIKWMTYGSYFSILAAGAYLLYFLDNNDMETYDMYKSYLLLPHTLLALRSMFDKTLKTPRVIKLLLTCMGFVYILSMGTRGPMIITMVYLFSLVFKNFPNMTLIKKVIITSIFVLLLYVIITGLYIDILLNLQRFMSNKGLSTRIIDMIISGEYISSTSGRDKIYELLWEKIIENPFGYGIFGEWQFINYSAHNIYIQLCMHYGLIFGSVIAVLYVCTILYAFFKSDNIYAKDLILLYFVFTVVRSIFGGDYLSDYFFFLLGLSLNQIRQRKTYNCNVKNIGGEYLR